MKNKHRKLARERFWEGIDKKSYHCPDCGRNKKDVVRFEVHHKDGVAYNNKEDNLVALCHFCHCLRENRKPSIDSIRLFQKKSNETEAENHVSYDVGYREYCNGCGVIHRHCKLCDSPIVGSKRLENGVWADARGLPNRFDFLCASWGKNHLNLFFHIDDFDCEP